MQAKSKLPYPVQAFTGRQYVTYEWRPVPAGCEDEARRLASDEGGSVLELQEVEQTKEENAAVPGPKPPANLDIEPLELDEPVGIDDAPILAVDLDDKTIIELKEMAKAAGITVGRKSKAELIDALRDD